MADIRQECKDILAGLLGRELTPSESRELIPALHAQMVAFRNENPQAWDALTKDQRVQVAAGRVADNLVKHAQQMRYRAHLQLKAAKKTQLQYKNNAERGRYGYRSVALLLENAYKQIRGVQQQYYSRVATEIKNAIGTRWFGLMEDELTAFAFVREMHGEDSGSAIAKQAAKVVKDMFEAMRQRFNRAGGDIGLLEDWNMPQSHDQWKVRNAANVIGKNRLRHFSLEQSREAWINFIWDKIDKTRYLNDDGDPMSADELRTMLSNVWATLVTDGNGDDFGSRVIRRPNSLGRANRYGQHRALHFKDAKSYFDYERKFGTGSTMNTIVSRIRSMSKDIALLENLGPNPQATYSTLKRIANSDLERANLQDSDLKRAWLYRDWNGALGVGVDAMWDTLNGNADTPAGTGRMASIGQGIRNLQVAGKLGSALISSLSDLPTYHVALMANGINPLTAPFSIMRALSREDTEFAARAGLLADTVNEGLCRWYEGNIGNGATAMMADLTIRASLLNAWTNTIRRAAGLNFMAASGKLVKSRKWGELNSYDRSRMQRHGFTERDWELLRLASPVRYRGCDMLTRESLEGIPEEVLATNGYTRGDVDSVTTKWLSMITDESYMASIEPDLASRTAMSRGLQRGTWSGEFMRSFMLFKSFPFAMMTRHFSRGHDLWQSGHKAGAMLYGAGIMTGTTIFGALSLQAANMLAGRDAQDVTTWTFWGNAMMKGGGLGVFGDMLYNGVFAENRYGSPNVLSFMGPVAGTVFDTWDTAMSMRDAAMYDKETRWEQKAFRLVRSNTPFMNVWYAKTALDHACLNDFQEFLSPGYFRRQRDRTRRSTGQGYWWKQQDMLPSRAPRMANQPN